MPANQRSSLDGPLYSRFGMEDQNSIQFFDDFMGGYTTIAAPWPNTPVGLNWTQNITGAAPPTVTAVADQIGGAVALTLTSASQAQEAALTQADQRCINILNGCVFEARVIVNVVPTSLAKFFIGLGANRAADPDSVTHMVNFAFTSAGLLVESDDNATDNSVATVLTTLAANDVFVLRGEIDPSGNCRYYAQRNPATGAKQPEFNQMAPASTLRFAATGTNAVLQPYLAAAKASGAGVGTLYVDYFYCRCLRY